MLFRELRPEEVSLLKDFLYEAIFVPEGAEPPERSIIEKPELALYYERWGNGPADYCIVAEEAGKVVGAVWTRLMHDYGYVDDETPSFAISLNREYRGKGIGTELMRRMLDQLRSQGYRQASLAVQKANDAVRMYEKVGFQIASENDEEYIMICKLQGGDPMSKQNDIQAIAEVVEGYCKAIHTGERADFDAIFCQSEEAALISIGKHFQGAESIYQDFIKNAIHVFYQSIDLIQEDLTVNFVSEDVAVAIFTYHTECIRAKTGEFYGIKGKETQVIRREGDAWKLFHVHYSKVD